MKREHLLVLGYFGYHTNQLDGQTVKTRDLYKLVVNEKGNSNVSYFDTENFQYNKMSIFTLLKSILSSNCVLYLPAHNNLKYIFPVLFLLSKIFRFEILYFIVGGWLVEYLENKPMHRWMLKRIKAIFSETQLMCNSLKSKYDFENINLFPNFRFVSFVPSEYHEDGKLKIVFVARINKMKGLDTIFSLAKYIESKYKNRQIIIDFYGPIHKPDETYFYTELEKYDFVDYKGELQPENINQVIMHYDLMLLPTHYYTEGLPGSVLDAYMSGIPIVVTRWKHAEEFVINGETGFIIPFENGLENLQQIIDALFDNTKMLHAMKKKAYMESFKYTSKSAWEIINKYIQ